MMLLPSELYKQMNMSVNLYFGKPIPYTRFSKNLAWEQAQELKDFVYTLSTDRNKTF
jgi:hypothetical protein